MDESKTITPDSLVNDKGTATVADGFDEKIGDVVTPMIDGNELTPMSPVVVIAPNFEVDFPRAALEQAGGGSHDFTYTVTDRAGNKSLPAADIVTLKLVLREAPANLQRPLVSAADNGLIGADPQNTRHMHFASLLAFVVIAACALVAPALRWQRSHVGNHCAGLPLTTLPRAAPSADR